MSEHNGYLNQVLSNINVRCLSIISMHQMDQKMLSYIMLMTVSIGIPLRFLENGLWQSPKDNISCVTLDPVADYVYISDLNTRLSVG